MTKGYRASSIHTQISLETDTDFGAQMQRIKNQLKQSGFRPGMKKFKYGMLLRIDAVEIGQKAQSKGNLIYTKSITS